MKILRASVKEKRTNYIAEYKPADSNSFLAYLCVTYKDRNLDSQSIKQNIESEFSYWINKYPVPLMVTAFDYKGDMLQINDSFESSLIGFKDINTNTIVKHWKTLKDKEFPEIQKTIEYQHRIYANLPHEEFDPIVARENFVKKMKSQKRVVISIGLFIILYPLSVELIAQKIDFINNFLIFISLLLGAYKAAKFLGWIKPRETETLEANKKNKMEHYFYHCEKNPTAFEALRSENFIQEQIKNIEEEFKN